MKKIKNILLVLLVMVLVVPFNVKAEEKKELPEADKEPVNVYLFHSYSCQYCQAALEWFASIEEEYGDYFNLLEYEVSTEENAMLWSDVAEFMGDTAEGVPYMVVGEYSYPNGFGADTVIDSTTNQTMGDQLLERILEIYESDNRYDVIYEMNNQPDYSNIVGIAAIVIIVGLGAVAVISRRQNS